MNLRDILTLYDYNYWANHRILAAGAGVSLEQFTFATTHSFGSLRGTLVHTLDTEYSWRMLLQHNTLDFRAMEEEDFPTFEALPERWQEEELAVRDFLIHLTDADLTGIVRYPTD